MAESTIGNIKAKIDLDSTNFTQSLKAINTRMAIVREEFKATAVGLDKVGDASKIAEAKIEKFTKLMAEQRKVVDTLKDTHKELSDKFGEGSKQALEYELKVKKAETTIKKFEAELNQANKELSQEARELDDVGDEAKQTTMQTDRLAGANSRLSRTMSVIGKGFRAVGMGLATVGAVSVVAVAGLGRMTAKAMENADEIQKNAEIYGMTAEKIQELMYVGSQLDVELGTMTKAQTMLTRAMGNAQDGSKQQAEAFKKLGVSITEPNGELRDIADVMAETFEALKKTDNQTERNSVSLRLFGKSAMALNPLINAGGKEIAKFTEESKKVGAVISNEGIKALDNLGDSIEGIKLAFKGLSGEVAVGLLPMLNSIKDFIISILPEIKNAIKTGDFTQIGTIITDAITQGLQKLGNVLPKILPIVAKMLGGIITAIATSLPAIIPSLINSLLSLINMLLGVLQTNASSIIQAIVKGIVSLVEGVAKSMPTLIPTMVTLVLALVDALIEALPQLITASVTIITELANGIIKALPTLMEKMPIIIEKIVTALIVAIPLLLQATTEIILALTKFFLQPKNIKLILGLGLSLVVAIGKGIIKAIPEINKSVQEFNLKLAKKFEQLPAKALKWGKDMIDGFIDGLKNKVKSVIGVVQNVAEEIKKFLGFSAPEEGAMKDYETWMPDFMSGLARGIKDNKGKVTSAIKGLSADMSVNVNPNFNGALVGGNSQNITLQIDGKTLATILAPHTQNYQNKLIRGVGR